VATTTRQTAEERREAVLVAAVTEFARAGFHGASTDAIARRAGISQPYLFRLFGSKKSSTSPSSGAVSAHAGNHARRRGLRREALSAMGDAYGELLATDPAMPVQLQTCAALTTLTCVRRS
jgi:AcrR family transcriptional regulator